MNHERTEVNKHMDINIIKSRLMGVNFTRLLKQLKTSKYAVARDCGISWRTLRYWETGHQKPSDKLALRVAEYLGLINPAEETLLDWVKKAQALQKEINGIIKKAVDTKKEE